MQLYFGQCSNWLILAFCYGWVIIIIVMYFHASKGLADWLCILLFTSCSLTSDLKRCINLGTYISDNLHIPLEPNAFFSLSFHYNCYLHLFIFSFCFLHQLSESSWYTPRKIKVHEQKKIPDFYFLTHNLEPCQVKPCQKTEIKTTKGVDSMQSWANFGLRSWLIFSLGWNVETCCLK